MSDYPRRGWPRWRGVLLFLAIVWSIGGSFLLLQSLSTNAVDGLLLNGDGHIGLPRQTAAARANCVGLVARLPPVNSATLRVAESKQLAWRLGAHLGSAFAFVDTGRSTPQQTAMSMAETQTFAHRLGVPEVAFPQAGRALYRLYDFTVALEEDPQCVAAALAARYSAQHANLYKFGAAAGVSYIYRVSVPQAGSVLGVQIKTYGTAAGVPAELWGPLLANPATDGSARTQADSIITGIENYLNPAAQ